MTAGVRKRRHELSVGNALCEYVQTPTSNNWSASYSEEQVMVEKQESHIVVKDMTLAYGSNVVQQNVSFTVNRGDVFIIMGGSGCG